MHVTDKKEIFKLALAYLSLHELVVDIRHDVVLGLVILVCPDVRLVGLDRIAVLDHALQTGEV